MSYETKYLKYKMKYLALKNQVGAAYAIPNINSADTPKSCFYDTVTKKCIQKKGIVYDAKCETSNPANGVIGYCYDINNPTVGYKGESEPHSR